MTDDTIEMNRSEFQLLVDLAGIARNPRLDTEVAPLIGGAARARAAKRAHDKALALLREDSNDED